MKRRGFLASILAAGFAPAAIGSDILMPVRAIAQQWLIALHTADGEQITTALTEPASYGKFPLIVFPAHTGAPVTLSHVSISRGGERHIHRMTNNLFVVRHLQPMFAPGALTSVYE